MSKRNFILLILVLAIIVGSALAYLYVTKPKNTGTESPDDSNFMSNFNPFGTSTNVPPQTPPPVNVGGTDNPTPPPEDISALQLIKVSSMPVAGFGVFSKERYVKVPEVVPEDTAEIVSPSKTNTKIPLAPATEFVPAVRYVEKATGNIFQTFIDEIQERKFSSTVIPKIHEAHFGNNAQSVIMRYLKTDDKTISTFVGTLPKELLGGDTSDTNEVTGYFLPENITDLSVSSDGSKIFYLLNVNDTATGISTDFTGVKKTQIFDSAFTEWLTGWQNVNNITLNTKPSRSVPGFLYKLDPNKKTFTKILGDINGLTTLTSPNGKLVLYGDSNLTLGIYNTETRESSPLSVRTLPEKCVWTKPNDALYCAVPKQVIGTDFPDSWYKGEVSFSDALWRIDVADGNTTILLDPTALQNGEDMDMIKLSLDMDGNYIFWVNKKDSYLWEVRLN